MPSNVCCTPLNLSAREAWMFHRQVLVTTFLLTTVIVVTAPRPGRGQAAPAVVRESANIRVVWEREEAYWRYAKAGDTERYRALWADGFRGWPSDRPHPVAKTAVTDWIEKMREQKIQFTYTLTREGAADFGDVVVVYYQAETLSEFPDGHVEGRGEVSRMTHTWRRFGDSWRIIGGMSADVQPTLR